MATASFRWLWVERGTGAKEAVSVWQPQAPSSEYALIGNFDRATHLQPTGGALVVKAVNEDPAYPLLKPPSITNFGGSHGVRAISRTEASEKPIMPQGYVAIGMVGNPGFDKPRLYNYRCVREDLFERRPYGIRFFHNKGSGSRMEGAFFGILDFPGLDHTGWFQKERRLQGKQSFLVVPSRDVTTSLTREDRLRGRR